MHELTAVAQAAAIRRGDLSPVDLVETYLTRLDAAAGLGAFVTVTDEAARAAAKAAEVAVTMGEDLPPLHGVPIALKDLTDTAGVRTTYGSLAFADHVPDTDAEVVRLLRAAGTISLGKTTTSEFGTTLYTENLLHPPARNPWRTDLSPGGSSGGAAVAVSAGLVAAAQGSDGGGSLRVPAALCGLVGFKPSRGLVPGRPSRYGLASNGPIARTVADAAALLDAMVEPAGSFLAACARPPRRLRVARFVDPPLADTAVAPACLAAVDRAGTLLAELGHEVVDVPGPYPAGMLDDFRIVQYGLAAGREPTGPLTKMTRWLAERGAATAPAATDAAYDRLTAALRRADAALAAYDVVLTPTVARPSVPVGYFAAMDPIEDFDAQTAFSPYCSVYNLSGRPALSLPVDRDDEGMPVGVMLASARGADATLLAVAAELADTTGWQHRYPAIRAKLPSATVIPTTALPVTRGALKL